MKVRFTPEAKADLFEATTWYGRRSSSLGRTFLEAVGSAAHLALRFPEAYPVSHRHVRRIRLRRFPYALFYELADAGIVVVGCFHLARDPRQWQIRGEV